MKTTLKSFLITLFGTLYLSFAYSAEPHSDDHHPSSSAVDSTSSKAMGTSGMVGNSTPGNTMMEKPETGMGHSEMGKAGMSNNGMDKNEMNQKAMPNSNMPETEMAGFSRGTVARSIFTTSVDNREPVDKIKNVPDQTNDVFYFTELRDMEGQTAKHRWEYKGKVVAEVKFNVRGPRWRVWSKKSFTPGWSGDWKVSVVNGADEIISEEVIAFSEPTHDIVENEELNKSMPEKNMMPHSNESPTAPAMN